MPLGPQTGAGDTPGKKKRAEKRAKDVETAKKVIKVAGKIIRVLKK